jgi:ABC-type cobalamin/Fe3+-siderophores transport system ATPase subunit
VLTSHDPQAALAESDLVLALSGGRAAYLGPPGGLNPETLRSLYA